MLRKKEVYTNITPIPANVPRQLAVDILHSHGEIITLNPLVLEFHPIKAPRDAEADEFYSTWYEITERIQYIPGVGKMGSGKLSFRGCFHNMPWGLQTHIYTPMNIEIRNKWRIAGNQPGEPPEIRELGLGAPADGLYLREDIEIKCNITLVSFVKSQMKAASKILVDRLIKKAELLDSGALHAMFEDGQLKTVNPADLSSPLLSQAQPLRSPMSPSFQYRVPQTPTSQYRPMTADGACLQPPPQNEVIMELPGDFYHPATAQNSPALPSFSPNPDAKHSSTGSDYGRNSYDPRTGRWSDYQSTVGSRPTSYSSDTSGFRSPGPEHKSFHSELPAMQEGREEHDDRHNAALRKLEAYSAKEQEGMYKYNPQDFANPALRRNQS